MSTTNNVFIDSSLLIENIKGTRKKLLFSLLNDASVSCCLNETVISEFMFHFLKVNSNTSPQSLQSSERIASVFKLSDNYNLLKLFHFLTANEGLIDMVPTFMATYNLLPNDAIILATCKIHNITKLASHDSDFILPCAAEGIELLREE